MSGRWWLLLAAIAVTTGAGPLGPRFGRAEEAGHSAFVQVQAGAFLGRDETRLNLRAVILVTPPDPNLPPPCVPSLEVIDGATGQTRLLSAGGPRTYSGNHNETLVRDLGNYSRRKR